MAIALYVCFVARRRKRPLEEESQYVRTLTGFGNKGLARDEEGLSHAMSWKVSYANNNSMNLYNSFY